MAANESFEKVKQYLSLNGYLTEEASAGPTVEGMSTDEVKETIDQMVTRGLVVFKKPILDSRGKVQIAGRWALTTKGRAML